MIISKEIKKNELVRIKKAMDICLYIITLLQIFQEFGGRRYFNYTTLTLSIIECVLFFYGHILISVIYHAVGEINLTAYNTLTEFHNTFVTGLIIPMIFIFTDIGLTATNALTYDIIKKASIAVILPGLGMYRLILMLAGYLKKRSADKAREASYAKTLSLLLILPAIFDSLTVGCMLLLYIGLIINNTVFAFICPVIALFVVLTIILTVRKKAKSDSQ